MKKFKSVVLLLLWVFSANAFPKNILFLSYDYGDANNFKIIIKNLPQRDKYKIIAIGKARELFIKEAASQLDCLSNSDNERFIQDRSEDLSITTLECLKNIISKNNFKPNLIVTGMSSSVLAQIMNSYQNLPKVAYFDNLDPYQGDDNIKYYTYSFMNKLDISTLSALFIPDEVIIGSFKNFGHGNFYGDIEIVGSPALSLWESEAAGCSSKNNLIDDLKIDKSKKQVIFAGDTTTDYKRSFKQFVLAMNELRKYEAIVTYHPKTDGEIEKSTVNEYAKFNNIKIINPNVITTYCLAKLSDVFIVHESSMGTQALSVPKNVIFIADENFHNTAIDNALATKAFDVNDIVSSIVLATRQVPNNTKFYSYYKMPKPKNSILKFIESMGNYFADLTTLLSSTQR